MSAAWWVALAIVLGSAVAALLATWGYFARFTVPRPPIGVLSLGDVALMLVLIVLVPYLYLLLPGWLVVGWLVVGTVSLLLLAAEPIVSRAPLRWLAALALVAADVLLAWRVGTLDVAFVLVNNGLQIIIAVAVANLWVQSGMSARSVVILSVCLIAYDLVFTSYLPVMGDLVTRMAALPVAPLIRWPVGTQRDWMGFGLGDVLLASVVPIVLYKAYGRTAGRVALVAACAAFVGVFALPLTGLPLGLFPMMVVLGPLALVQYGYWTWRRGPERTMGQYLVARQA